MAFVKHFAAVVCLKEVKNNSYVPQLDDPDLQPQAASVEIGKPSTLASVSAYGHKRKVNTSSTGWMPPSGHFELFFEGVHA